MYKTAVCVFQPKTTGEQKTKPTQASVRELRGLGLSPDIVSSFCCCCCWHLRYFVLVGCQ